MIEGSASLREEVEIQKRHFLNFRHFVWIVCTVFEGMLCGEGTPTEEGVSFTLNNHCPIEVLQIHRRGPRANIPMTR